GAVSLRGAAGTGKTATLQELHRGLAEGGRDVLAVAPTRSAVNELRQVGFSDAMTIQRLAVAFCNCCLAERTRSHNVPKRDSSSSRRRAAAVGASGDCRRP